MSRRSRQAARRFEWLLLGTAGLVLVAACLALLWLSPSPSPKLVVTLYMPLDCARCERYADHLRSRGFEVHIDGERDLDRIRSRYRIPRSIRTTPIGIVRGIFVAGHVPTLDIRRVVHDPRDAIGVVVPGAPAGAPGVETTLPTQFTVYLVRPSGLMQPIKVYNHAIHFW